MADKLKLELVTPYRKVLEADVEEIVAPGAEGEFGVLPGHTPLLTTLKVGELTYRDTQQTYHVALNWGYFELSDDQVKILVETAEPADEIDLERARQALGRAEEKLKKLTPEDRDYRVMESALERALIRVQVASRKAK